MEHLKVALGMLKSDAANVQRKVGNRDGGNARSALEGFIKAIDEAEQAAQNGTLTVADVQDICGKADFSVYIALTPNQSKAKHFDDAQRLLKAAKDLVEMAKKVLNA